LFGPATLAFEGGSSLISPDGSLVIAFLIFLLFCVVMNRLLFKPIGRVLDQRSRMTDGARAEARAAEQTYENRVTEYEATLRQAKGESYRFQEQQRVTALHDRTVLLEQAKETATKTVEEAKSELAVQVVGLRSSLKEESREIAAEITKSVLGRVVDGGAN